MSKKKYNIGYSCPECEGKGRIWSCGPADNMDVFYEECDMCGGSGRVKKRPIEPVKLVTPKVRSLPLNEPCPRCNGLGSISGVSEPLPCDYCRETGVVKKLGKLQLTDRANGWGGRSGIYMDPEQILFVWFLIEGMDIATIPDAVADIRYSLRNALDGLINQGIIEEA